MIKISRSTATIMGEITILLCSLVIAEATAKSVFEDELDTLQLLLASYMPFVITSTILLWVFRKIRGEKEEVGNDTP